MAPNFASRACVQRKLREFVPDGVFMNFYSTIPFQQSSAAKFDVEACDNNYAGFVKQAAAAGCQIRMLAESGDAMPCRHALGHLNLSWHAEAKKRTATSANRVSNAADMASALVELRGAGGKSSSKKRRFAERALEVLQARASSA